MARPLSTNVVIDYIMDDDPTTSYASIPQALSLLNRKAFREGYIFSVDYIEFIGRTNDTLSIVKIPEGYSTTKAWTMGFNAWKEQRHHALELNEGSEPGKWSDFKVLMDINDNSASRLKPNGMSAAGTSYVPLSIVGSEWNTGTIVVNDPSAATTTEFDVGMLGPNLGTYGALVQTWGDTRAGTMAPDPNMPAATSLSWIMRSGEESSDMAVDVLNNIEGDNDIPPYANVVEDGTSPTPIYVGGELSAPGGVLHDIATLGTTGRPFSMSGGLFPLGLMKLVPSWSDTSPGQERIVRVHCTRGSVKGIAALKVGAFR